MIKKLNLTTHLSSTLSNIRHCIDHNILETYPCNRDVEGEILRRRVGCEDGFLLCKSRAFLTMGLCKWTSFFVFLGYLFFPFCFYSTVEGLLPSPVTNGEDVSVHTWIYVSNQFAYLLVLPLWILMAASTSRENNRTVNKNLRRTLFHPNLLVNYEKSNQCFPLLCFFSLFSFYISPSATLSSFLWCGVIFSHLLDCPAIEPMNMKT